MARIGCTQERGRKNVCLIGFEAEFAALGIVAGAISAALSNVEPIVAVHVLAARRNGFDADGLALRRDPNTTPDRQDLFHRYLLDISGRRICPRTRNNNAQNRDS